jgi:hypothetical protein
VGGPGLAFETWISPANGRRWKNPGLKIETWATHLSFSRAAFIFLAPLSFSRAALIFSRRFHLLAPLSFSRGIFMFPRHFHFLRWDEVAGAHS